MKKLGKRKNVILNSIAGFACVCALERCIALCDGNGNASSAASTGISQNVSRGVA